MAKIVIIIPTYNEAASTPQMISALSEVIPGIKKHQVSVLYVDDSSPDGTGAIVTKLRSKYPWLHLLTNPKKGGLGLAYASGMKYAMNELKADWLMEFDADFQHPPADIPRLVAQIDSGYDYIVGSRYIPGGSIPGEWGLDRKFLSVIGNLVARILLIMPAIHDVTGGFKLSRVKGFMDEFNFDKLLSRSFAYKIHLFHFMVNRGARVKEVPFVFGNRTQGESKIIKNEMQETLKVIFKLQSKNPKIRQFIKFGIVGFTGFLVNSLSLEFFAATPLPDLLGRLFYFLDPIPVLTLFAHSPAWAAAMAAEMAIISNFLFNNFWTFASHKAKTFYLFVRKFVKFNLTSLGAVMIQFSVIGTATQIFGDNVLVRQVSLVVSIVFFIVPYNWFMYNKYIWKKK